MGLGNKSIMKSNVNLTLYLSTHQKNIKEIKNKKKKTTLIDNLLTKVIHNE